MSDPSPLETAEYQFVVSPSALDTAALKPPTTALKVRFGAVSHAGKVRTKNEDHFLVTQFSRTQKIVTTNLPDDQIPEHKGDDSYSMIVADGMGGMAAGDVASRMAIATGIRLFQKSPKWGFKINRKEARELLERANAYLREIDMAITQKSEGDRKLFGMGTTLTAAYSIGVDLFIIHVGDSRAYLYRNGVLCQLTRDHTVAQAMADAGYIPPEEVRHHNKRNVLTNFLGGHHGKVKADVRWLRLADGDRVLVCSDGLTDMVDDASIGRILGACDKPNDAAQSLVDEALTHGGKDNVTVLVARYEIPRPQPGDHETQTARQPIGESTESMPQAAPLPVASIR
jgi:serine/threonine protein phosphatase PrpC